MYKSLTVTSSLGIPVVDIQKSSASLQGCVAYDKTTKIVHVSNGVDWTPIVDTQQPVSRALSSDITANSAIIFKQLTIPAVNLATTSLQNTGSIIYDTGSKRAYLATPTGWIPLSGATITAANNTIVIGGTTTNVTIAGNYVGGSGITITGNVVSNTGVTSLIAGPGITLSPPTGLGNVTITASGIAGVSSFSGGTTGLLPNLPSSGAIVLSGILSAANGGTGAGTYTNGEILIGNTGTGLLVKNTITAGSGISIVNGAGTITITNSAPGTAYAAGAGISIVGPTISNTGVLSITGTPNQIIALPS